MTAAEEVLLAIDDGVATISLNRPDKLNAVTPPMAARIGALLRECDAEPDVRAIVLTGRGRGFCAGADLAVLAEGPAALAAFVRDPAAFPTDALTIRKPVVAAVNGPVAGVGIAYVAAADVRFASSEARFTTSFARLGLVAEYGLSWLLPRLIGYPAAADLLLSGRTIDASEALRIGLVAEVVAPEELMARAATYARDLAHRCSPRSLAVIKEQLRADARSDRPAAFDRSIALMVESFDAPDLKEAMEAGSARRLPHFPPLGPPGRQA
ncbi:MAG: enoyl-CoA hydratase [Pseudonocardiales bacterium]|nr:enoyl-CoA hydratase [Pseudonocardiales bacterium]